MKMSRRAEWIASACMFAMAISYYAFIFANRDRAVPENWDYHLRGGVMMLSGAVGIAIHAMFYDRIEAWKARRQEKLKGSVLGTDITRWFRTK